MMQDGKYQPETPARRLPRAGAPRNEASDAEHVYSGETREGRGMWNMERGEARRVV